MHHVEGDVAMLAGTKAVPLFRCFAHDGGCVFRNALAVKRRLGDLSLAAMLGAFGGDHAFAEEHL